MPICLKVMIYNWSVQSVTVYNKFCDGTTVYHASLPSQWPTEMSRCTWQ
jgi:hypothetical protein